MDLPKPQFSFVGRLYAAVISEGLKPGNLNRENTDTVIRKLSKTPWLDANLDLHNLWILGGDNWGDAIKAVRSYSSDVNNHRRQQKAKEKENNKKEQ
jgi:hypothetical protein